MGRLDTRVERLEAAAPQAAGSPCAVIRFNPGEAQGWLPDMLARVGWPASQVALVTIDGRAPEGADPEMLVPPIAENRLSASQRATLANAGRHAGPWWVAVAGRGWADAHPAPQGEAALIADLKRQRDRAKWGHAGEF